MLQHIKEEIEIVPVTTRSLEQYKRINLFKDDYIPKYALVSNGGILLEKGKINLEWLEETKEIVKECNDEIEKAYEYLQRDKNIIFDIRNIDDLFLFTKSKDIKNTARELEEILDLNKVKIEENLNKIYVLPKILDKGLALRRLRDKLKPKHIYAAGDSVFDLPMLREADEAIALEEFFFSQGLNRDRIIFWEGDKNRFSNFVLQEKNKKMLKNYCKI